jgi:uncharacterized protein YceK
MKKLILILAVAGLTGCSTIMEYIPSRWDVNQAKVATDIQQQSRSFDCKGDQAQQLASLQRNIEWFDLYAKTKPTRDVAKLTAPMTNTVKEFQERVAKGPVSPLYCDMKRKLFIQQADIIGGAVQGRF